MMTIIYVVFQEPVHLKAPAVLGRYQWMTRSRYEQSPFQSDLLNIIHLGKGRPLSVSPLKIVFKSKV